MKQILEKEFVELKKLYANPNLKIEVGAGMTISFPAIEPDKMAAILKKEHFSKE